MTWTQDINGSTDGSRPKRSSVLVRVKDRISSTIDSYRRRRRRSQSDPIPKVSPRLTNQTVTHSGPQVKFPCVLSPKTLGGGTETWVYLDHESMLAHPLGLVGVPSYDYLDELGQLTETTYAVDQEFSIIHCYASDSYIISLPDGCELPFSEGVWSLAEDGAHAILSFSHAKFRTTFDGLEAILL